jgi:hypothetical protein
MLVAAMSVEMNAMALEIRWTTTTRQSAASSRQKKKGLLTKIKSFFALINSILAIKPASALKASCRRSALVSHAVEPWRPHARRR